MGTHAHISLDATHTTRLSYDQMGRRTCIPKELHLFANYTYAACQACAVMEGWGVFMG